jgi:hypothetical protein
MDIDILPEPLIENARKKTSFSFSQDTLTDLEKCCFTARSISGSRKINKSLLMEVAFCTAYAEFCAKKEHSQFYKDLVWFIEQKED